MTEKEFVSKSIADIKLSLKNFPDDFIADINCKKLSMPGSHLILGSEFFGQREILSTDGNLFLRLEDNAKVKYIIYSNRLKPKEILIPSTNDDILSVIKNYEKYLDSLLKKIESDFKKIFPDSKNTCVISVSVLNSLSLQRL